MYKVVICGFVQPKSEPLYASSGVKGLTLRIFFCELSSSMHATAYTGKRQELPTSSWATAADEELIFAVSAQGEALHVRTRGAAYF